jgi:membrane-bound lytic murein transglycosylase B
VKRFFLLLALIVATTAHASDFITRFPESRDFIKEMSKKHKFRQKDLEKLFAHVKHQPGIIEAISRPAESKPWYQYRPIFVTADRIREGVKFWNSHAKQLAQAEKKYGVPPQIIVAIVGVETRFGRHSGNYRVIDALSTLAFDYPPRAAFFRQELTSFLLMSREEKRDPLQFTGSYAGAMGMPQFMPSSFLSYAVDFDKDGNRDLWDNTGDVIGSVANYFSRHHWKRGEPIASRAKLNGKPPQKLIDKGYQPSLPFNKLKTLGVKSLTNYTKDSEVALLALESSPGQMQYWVTLHNFYVITRYNHSPLYAMAVYQLGEAIRTTRAAAKRTTGSMPISDANS